MTSLTDKMEKLWREYKVQEDGEYHFVENTKVTYFNNGVNACIELAKAEAAVVGDWEAGFRLKRHSEYGSMMSFDERIDSEIDFITDLLTAEREAGAREVIQELRDIFKDTYEIGTNHLNSELDRLENK